MIERELLMFNQLKTQLLFMILSLLLASASYASNQASKDSAYLLKINPDSVLQLQLDRKASDPVEATHQIANQLAKQYGATIISEIANQHFAIVLSGISADELTAIVASDEVLSVEKIGTKDSSQRAPLSFNSINCSYTGLGDLYERVANVSGGSTPYNYQWTGANSTITSFGNVGFVRSCAGFTHESFRVVVTDNNGSQVSRTGSVSCIGGGF